MKLESQDGEIGFAYRLDTKGGGHLALLNVAKSNDPSKVKYLSIQSIYHEFA